MQSGFLFDLEEEGIDNANYWNNRVLCLVTAIYCIMIFLCVFKVRRPRFVVVEIAPLLPRDGGTARKAIAGFMPVNPTRN